MERTFVSIDEFRKESAEEGGLPRAVEAYAARAQKENQTYRALLEVFSDTDAQARKVEERLSRGEDMPLAGVPFVVKDNILIRGRKCGAASKILEGYVASYDATVIRKLKEAGVVFIGRSNMDEFAMGSSTENSAFGATQNPYAEGRAPGGSSGGSAAAVSARLSVAALGSDTGGSIRQPAAFCGVVGLKPTYGAVSRYGLIAMASSLDQIGPLAANVRDAEKIFDVIKGRDEFDSTTLSYASASQAKRQYTIGYPEHFLERGVDERVRENFRQSIQLLEADGQKVVAVSMPELEYSLPAYYIIMPAEASSNLARYDGIRYGSSEAGKTLLERYTHTRGEYLGREVKRRILLGTYVLSAGYYDAFYKRALAARAVIRASFKKAFEKCDAVTLPASPVPPFRLGERAHDPLRMYLADVFTVSANLAGIPAISVPSGFLEEDGARLPLGIQFMAPHFCEQTLFAIGARVEARKEHGG